MINKISTLNMPHEEWLAERRKSIGGSDAGSVLGLNEYTSPYALWAEKTGKVIPEDISDKESVRLGHDLEQYVADRFEEETGKKLRRCNYILRNDEYPFAHADVDRLVVGEKAGFEAKTTSSWEILQQCREGKFPDKFYAQCTHYMMVTGLERWYLGVLCFGHGFYWFTIERDEDEIKALASIEEDFWKHVTDKVPPAVDGSESTMEAIKGIYPESRTESIDLGAVEDSILLYQAFSAQIDELTAEMNAQKAIIMEFMANAEKGTVGNYMISYKTQTRKTFDRKFYEAENGPIHEKYFTESKSRPFKVTEKKEKK